MLPDIAYLIRERDYTHFPQAEPDLTPPHLKGLPVYALIPILFQHSHPAVIDLEKRAGKRSSSTWSQRPQQSLQSHPCTKHIFNPFCPATALPTRTLIGTCPCSLVSLMLTCDPAQRSKAHHSTAHLFITLVTPIVVKRLLHSIHHQHNSQWKQCAPPRHRGQTRNSLCAQHSKAQHTTAQAGT